MKALSEKPILNRVGINIKLKIMAVSGKELAALDFANLIGGPLNAVVEAQAKSAITTANFIKQVGFKEDGSVITTDFNITKTNSEGNKQAFTISVPFLTMLPIPYIKIDEAVIEFNAKITSITSSESASTFKNDSDISVEGKSWFASAKMTSKTSYQKTSSNSDKEERSFDMHVKVTASNTDMPSGTEKILNMLEESIHETPAGIVYTEAFTIKDAEGDKTYEVTKGDISKLKKDDEVKDKDGKVVGNIASIEPENKMITFAAEVKDTSLFIS